ncbi:bifunctional diaminohydroxyphosphoribosylaminopyrimidine deaminase/5-amino-6-(5-phosphoribosylamino)uracil reductase RibD [Colwelliaceae bacterium BS250]
MQQRLLDEKHMQRAIELAKKGLYTTSPNPMVGCVLVQGDDVIGEGWHQKAGLGHAEVNAIANAQANQKTIAGCTAYVTLEPCSHFGRTPPCAEGLIKVGVKHVVIAMQDPNPLVSGRGIAMLEQAAISTTVGVLENAAKAINPGFNKRMSKGLPLLRCKLASSIDGKTAMANGESKWITGAHARADVQNYRAQSCAIISGADTVMIDNAKLNVRYSELGQAQNSIVESQLRQPVRVIIDSKNRLTPDLALFKSESAIILVRIKMASNLEKKQQWPHFVEELLVQEHNNQADLTDLLKKLAERGFNNVWLEAGSRLSGAFVGQGLVDELVLYQAPKLMGANAQSLFDIEQLVHLKDAIQLSFTDVRMVGDDLRIVATLKLKAL